MLKKLFTLAIIACTALIANAQKFEGKIDATISVLKAPAEMAGMEAMMGQTITSSFKGHRSHTLMRNMMGTTAVITDSIKKEMIILNDMMGQKTAMVTPMETNATPTENMGLELNGAKITKVNERKLIAGYDCKKAMVDVKDENGAVTTVELWYCEQIAPVEMKGEIRGTPMEFTMTVEGITMKYEVTAVTKEVVAESLFSIPAGYTLQSMDQMYQNFESIEQK
jgi:hypothetical protein